MEHELGFMCGSCFNSMYLCNLNPENKIPLWYSKIYWLLKSYHWGWWCVLPSTLNPNTRGGDDVREFGFHGPLEDFCAGAEAYRFPKAGKLGLGLGIYYSLHPEP